MTLAEVNAFKPVDTGDLEGRRLTDAQVASAFHVPPELVGAVQGNYSNIDAFRQMLYGRTLGPIITQIEQAMNGLLRLLPDPAGRDLYVEANVKAKTQGSFIEQAQAASTSAGAPWATRNEIRAMQNLPALPGGDELVVPLNVSNATHTPNAARRVPNVAHRPKAGQPAAARTHQYTDRYERAADALLARSKAERAIEGALRKHGAAVLDAIPHRASAATLTAIRQALAADLLPELRRTAVACAMERIDAEERRKTFPDQNLDGWLRRAADSHATAITDGWVEKLPGGATSCCGS